MHRTNKSLNRSLPDTVTSSLRVYKSREKSLRDRSCNRLTGIHGMHSHTFRIDLFNAKLWIKIPNFKLLKLAFFLFRGTEHEYALRLFRIQSSQPERITGSQSCIHGGQVARVWVWVKDTSPASASLLRGEPTCNQICTDQSLTGIS